MPLAARVVEFIGVAYSDAVAGEGEQFLDQPIFLFLFPLFSQEADDFGPAGDEQVAVPPDTVFAVGERDFFCIAAVPAIFSQAYFFDCSLMREWW
jgi:hypothetical protein